MEKACIYKITNTINSKCYIGRTVNFSARMSAHKNAAHRGEGFHLGNSIRKYGIENFTFEKLGETSELFISSFEKYWIHKMDSFRNGYNQTNGGDGGIPGYKHSPETKHKMSINNCMKNPVVAKKNGIARSGMKHSTTSKNNMSNGMRKFYDSGGQNPMLGKHHSPSSRDKISMANKKWLLTNKPTRLGVTHLAESKLKMSVKQKELQNKKYRCRYCPIEVDKCNLNRWHNEKCKYKDDNFWEEW